MRMRMALAGLAALCGTIALSSSTAFAASGGSNSASCQGLPTHAPLKIATVSSVPLRFRE